MISNYDKQVDIGGRFLNYDQEALIQKYTLDADADFSISSPIWEQNTGSTVRLVPLMG